MPKVSIIMPVYNVGPYLDEAFQSLLCQSLADIEIIVVNDGATDDSQEHIDRFMAQDCRIRCYRQENQGLSGARNTGMRYCQGEYIYFMDSDDIIVPDALQTCYDLAQKCHADVCIFDADTFYEEGAKPMTWDYDRSMVLEENKCYEGESLFNLLLDREKHNAVVWLQFIRRDYLQRLSLNFMPSIIHEDELFTPQLLLQTDRVFYINRKFIRHRVRQSSIVGKGYSSRNIRCYLTVFDQLFRFQDSPTIRKFARYTLSRVFYTGHLIPFGEKFGVFWRAVKSGYLKYIGLKPAVVFWLKQK